MLENIVVEIHQENHLKLNNRKLLKENDHNTQLQLPRSISTGRFRRKNTGTSWNMNAVFRPVPVVTQGKLTGIHRKKSGQFPENSDVFL